MTPTIKTPNEPFVPKLTDEQRITRAITLSVLGLLGFFLLMGTWYTIPSGQESVLHPSLCPNCGKNIATPSKKEETKP